MRKYSYYIISSLLLSATVFVGGCAFTQKSNPISTPTVSSTGESVEDMTVSSTADEVDTSTWKTYRNEQAGFEVKIPGDWEKTNEIIHLDENGIPTTTEKLVSMDGYDDLTLSSQGFLYFGLKDQEYMDSNMVNFSIESFDSNLDLNILREKYKRFSGVQTVVISADMGRVISSLKNDASSLVKKGDRQDSWNFSHHVLIKNGHEYFLIGIFTVASSEEKLSGRISEYSAVLRSFRPTHVDEVDASAWKTYRNEELGFEMKVPVEWGEVVFLSKTDVSDSRNFPFWMREIDGLSFRNEHIDIMFASEYSSSTVGTYAKRFGLERGRERVVNGMLAYEEITKEVIPTSVGNEVHSVADAVVVRDKDRGYFFDARVFSEDEQEIDRLIAEWFVVLGTFRSLNR